MTNLLITAGVLAVITIAAYLMFNYQDKNQPTETPTYTPEELENIKLVEELYNKDLRPEITEEIEVIADEVAPKPKKKRKYYPKTKK
jgi:hypothetical protein